MDPATGKELWRKQMAGTFGARGMNYWESPDRSDRRIFFLAGGMLTAINAQNGEVDSDLRQQRPRGSADRALPPGQRSAADEQPRAHLREHDHHVAAGAGRAATTRSPPRFRPTTCAPARCSGCSTAFRTRASSATTRWPPEAYKKSGGVHNWSESTVDEQRGIAFINFGSPRFDFYGGDRKGDNLFGNSLVAIDARTGRRIWHQQLVHHDLWDYDLPQAPKLLTIRQNGRNIDIVAQATKHGFLFVFERETGRPIWPIEERKVPQSDVPGEFSSPTQPFPTKPAPFARQSFTEKDINPYLPAAERQAIAERMKTLRNEGLFTPPSFEGSISLPGHNGGANFQTSAVDPTRGEMYVFAKALPTVDRIALPAAPGAGGRRRWRWRRWWGAGGRWRADHHARAEGADDQGRAGAGRRREGEGRRRSSSRRRTSS